MADVIQFIDSFDHYQPSTEWQLKYNNTNGVGQTTGRFSTGQAMTVTGSQFIVKRLTTSSAAWRFGYGFYLANAGSGTLNYMITLEDNQTHWGLLINGGTLTLQFHREYSTVGSPSVYTIPLATWIHLEVYAVCTDSISSGQAEVRINGVTELTLSSGDLRQGANGTPNAMQLQTANGWEFYIDDLIMSSMDTTTTPMFLGDKRVFCLYPSGNGNYSDFTGSDGNSTNNSLLVDEPSNIDLTDYVESADAGDRDSYAIDNPTLTPTDIACVAITACVAKADAGNRTFKPFVRISGTDYDQVEVFPPSSPTISQTIMETSPATATAWTSAEITALEAGIKIEA